LDETALEFTEVVVVASRDVVEVKCRRQVNGELSFHQERRCGPDDAGLVGVAKTESLYDVEACADLNFNLFLTLARSDQVCVTTERFDVQLICQGRFLLS
jgi:hypothetical protein